jgi:inner membrane protein
MDSLTHALLGLSLGALRKPDAPRGMPLTPTDRAVLLAAVIAAELPDLDYLWPAGDPVLGMLKAHRGISHSLFAAPLIALAAAGLAKAFCRGSRFGPVYLTASASVLFAHLLADAWTGWGTRLFLPLTSARVTLDWMMVIDPWFTLPLLAGAVVAFLRRPFFRRSLLMGGGVALSYLALRIGLQAHAATNVRAAYREAGAVSVFPEVLGVTRFRYVVSVGDGHAAGEVGAFAPAVEKVREFETYREPPRQFRRHLISGIYICDSPLCIARRAGSSVPALREALSWARFPVVRTKSLPNFGTRFEVTDLRYYWDGQPTLTFVIDVDRQNKQLAARLDRGGTARALFERWWHGRAGSG